MSEHGRVVFFGTISGLLRLSRSQGRRGLRKIGPDLSKIAVLRGKRDLLESVIFPVPALPAATNRTPSQRAPGKVYSGILKRERRLMRFT